MSAFAGVDPGGHPDISPSSPIIVTFYQLSFSTNLVLSTNLDLILAGFLPRRAKISISCAAPPPNARLCACVLFKRYLCALRLVLQAHSRTMQSRARMTVQ